MSEDKTSLDNRIRFNAAKLLQTDINAWKECGYDACQSRQSCLGGPRGTCARTLGWPACTEEGKERIRESKLKWRRSETYDKEAPSMRSMRRLNEEMEAFNLMLKAQEY